MIAAEVLLWGTRIGIVSQEDAQHVPVFRYDDAFIGSGIEVAPLTMPLSGRAYSFPNLNVTSFHLLPGLLSDSLPDKFGTALLRRYMEEQGRSFSDLTAVERLLYTGVRGMGALEFQPAYDVAESYDSAIDLDALVQLASDVLTERKKLRIPKGSHAMEQLLSVGSSAGGARAKAIIALNDETGEIRSGQIDAGEGFSYWLLKFDGVSNNKDKGDRADGAMFTRIEYAYSLMARAVGIVMSECRLHEEGGRYHFMTRRFDREEASGQKIHMQTLGAIAHLDFNQAGTSAYEQAADVIYRLGMDQKAVEELYRRMVFNVITRNQDDHVKNISFLMDRIGKWRLAPAYDLTYACDADNYWLARHQMSINGKLENITRDDLLQSAATMNISRSRALHTIGQVIDAAAAFTNYAKQAQIPLAAAKEILKQFQVMNNISYM